MNQVYDNISDFMEAVHEEVNLKETVIDMGLISRDAFRKTQFCSCIFHQGDNTPSLQVTDKFFKCYACGTAKGDLIKFIQLYYNIDFMEAVVKKCLLNILKK